MRAILVVALLALVGVIGDFYIKLSGIGPKYIDTKWFVLGFIIYASTAFGWFYAMKQIKLSSLGVIYALTTALLLVVLGIFYFDEKLNAYELVGIATAIISLILLSRFA